MDFIFGNYFELPFHPHTFDGVITDIPYKGCITKKLGEESFSFDDFLQKSDQETKKDAFLITFCNFLCAADLIAASKSTHWNYHTHQIWDKQPIRTWISWGHPLRHTEYIVYFKKGNFKFSFKTGETKEPYKRKTFGGSLKNQKKPNDRKVSHGMYSEILTFKQPKKKIHPTEKPKEFSKYFKQIIGKDAYVLDPFMGSGNLISAFSQSIGVDVVDYRQMGAVDAIRNITVPMNSIVRLNYST